MWISRCCVWASEISRLALRASWLSWFWIRRRAFSWFTFANVMELKCSANFMNFTFCSRALHEFHVFLGIVCICVCEINEFHGVLAHTRTITSWKSLRRMNFQAVFSRVSLSISCCWLLHAVALFLVSFGFGFLSVHFRAPWISRAVIRGRLSSISFSEEVMWSGDFG